MSSTGIEWTDRVWNPVRGCSPVSPGCANCYAATFARRFSRENLPYHGLVTSTGKWTGQVRFEAKRLGLPLKWRKGSRVFVDSMSDLFHYAVTDEQLAAVFGVMAMCHQHTFQVLTKRPGRAADWFNAISGSRTNYLVQRAAYQALGAQMYLRSGSGRRRCAISEREWPLRNVEFVVSCENQDTFDSRVPELVECAASVRGVSLEPLLGPIDLSRALWVGAEGGWEYEGSKRCWIDWVIVGCETGPWRRPCDVRWILDIVRQCREAGVPCFIKQIEVEASGGTRVSKDPREWPTYTWMRAPTELKVRMFPGDRW